MATKFVAEFNAFWTGISNQLELPEGTKAIMESTWNTVPWPAGGADAKKMNGYQFYLKSRRAELINDKTMDGSQRMKTIQSEWNAKSKAEKARMEHTGRRFQWCHSIGLGHDRRRQHQCTKGDEKEAPTGYNLFMKKMMEKLKAQGVAELERMTKIGLHVESHVERRTNQVERMCQEWHRSRG